jgi:hypothetical protein
VDLRFFIDPQTELPHIYNHGVTEAEVSKVELGGRLLIERDNLPIRQELNQPR